MTFDYQYNLLPQFIVLMFFSRSEAIALNTWNIWSFFFFWQEIYEVLKVVILTCIFVTSSSHLVIQTSQEVSDVPYADYFHVEVQNFSRYWIIVH
jgi:hypothetical protein